MYKLPKIKFIPMTFEENIAVMAMFIENDNYFKIKYPVLDGISFNNLNREQIIDVLRTNILEQWEVDTKDINNQVKLYQDNWDIINDEIMTDLFKRLNIKWPDDSLIIYARVGIMNIYPRYIGERTFDIGIDINIDKMREIAIHEICHFLYFEKWKELYNDFDEEHYNMPNIIWYLSEAIIDPLLNNDIFNKYTNVELRSYKMFYDINIEGSSIIERLRKNINSYNVEDAIKRSYQLFLDNEEIIKRSDIYF